MYRAGHIIRRSSVRLKSLSGGHGELQMIISQLKEVKSSFKAFIAAQSTLSEDLLKWSVTIENDILQNTFSNIGELYSLWTDVQVEFLDSLKHLKNSFNLILEGDHHVDQAKQIYSTKEENEKSIRKELQKAYNKGTTQEIQLLRDKLSRNDKVKELAHIDVVERTKENEAVRMIRVKEGLSMLSNAYVQMANKASIIFKTQEKVAAEIPDVHDRAIQSLKYRAVSGFRYIEEAKEKLRSYPTNSSSLGASYHEPPPPYSQSTEKMNDLEANFSQSSLTDEFNCDFERDSPPDNLPTAPLRQSSVESFGGGALAYPDLHHRFNSGHETNFPLSNGNASNENDSSGKNAECSCTVDRTFSTNYRNDHVMPLRVTRKKSNSDRRKSAPERTGSPQSSSLLNYSLREDSSSCTEDHPITSSESPQAQPPFNPFYSST